MAPKDLPWFRFYSEARRDPKIRKAAQTAGVSFLEALGFWTALLSMAGESPIRGKLLVTLQERFSNDDVTYECNTDATTTQKLLAAFAQYDMIAIPEDGPIEIINWNKRQFSSDKSTERVQKWRISKGENKECNVSETVDSVYVSDSYSSLSDEFTKITGIIPYDLEKWTRADQTLNAAGITPEDIRMALQLMADEELVVSGLPSIVKVAISVKSKREHHQPIFNNNGKRSERLLPDGV
jgi:hypothetical protein